MEQVSRERHVNTGNVMRAIETKLSTHYESQWKEKLQAEFAVRGEQRGRNKLRTYRMFKDSYMSLLLFLRNTVQHMLNSGVEWHQLK